MKKKVLITFYNPKNMGGPTVSMKNVMESYLKEKYDFIPIIIDERLGTTLKVSVLKRLIKEIKETNPDVVYVSGLQLHGFYMMLALCCARMNKKSILIVHGSACDDINVGATKRFLFRYFLEPFTVSHAGIVYTVCEEMANNKIIKDNVKIFGGVIHNASPSIDSNILPQYSLRKELYIKDNDFLMAYTGRVVEDKGISYLIRAMEDCSENVKLLIIGDGSDKPKYISMVEKLGMSHRIFFLGYRGDVLSIIKACNAFVFPSLHENLPNSLVEAAMVGLPIIATDVGGNHEIVRNDVNGILVPPMDSRSLSQAMNHLAMDSNECERLGKRGKRIVEEEFTKERIYPRIDKLFEDIINGGGEKIE